MKLSVIIPCYNAAGTIAAQLEALANQHWSEPWEVIIANNRSTDDTRAIVERYRGRISNLRVVDASERQGQPYALNTGVAAARGESVAFSDADDEIAPGWVTAMGEALSTYEFVACRVDDEKLNSPESRRMRGNNQREGIQKYRYPPYLPHAGGGTIGVRRRLLQAFGGFDETLPYLHDTDLCWRLQRAGTELHFVPEAVLHIRYRDNIRSIYRQARNFGEYNVILYKRYRPLGMPKLSWKQGVLGWVGVVRQLAYVRDRVGLGAWMWQFAWRVGRVRGSVKHRVLSL